MVFQLPAYAEALELGVTGVEALGVERGGTSEALDADEMGAGLGEQAIHAKDFTWDTCSTVWARDFAREMRVVD
ncbi:unnamed protein product [Ilex paraguariensis]|uniref:Uncharacterized protein n=1 Tax=Ilex paraguariensis TaxID=185542 RepID=A0ABC8SHJ2_9AQUA